MCILLKDWTKHTANEQRLSTSETAPAHAEGVRRTRGARGVEHTPRIRVSFFFFFFFITLGLELSVTEVYEP